MWRLILGVGLNTVSEKIKDILDKRLYSWPGSFAFRRAMPTPTQSMLNGDPIFDAIYNVIKYWDINISDYYSGYCGGNGSHATLIYNAIMRVKLK